MGLEWSAYTFSFDNNVVARVTADAERARRVAEVVVTTNEQSKRRNRLCAPIPDGNKEPP